MRDMDVGSRFAAPDSRQTLTFVLVAIIFPANQINIFDLYLHLFPAVAGQVKLCLWWNKVSEWSSASCNFAFPLEKKISGKQHMSEKA